MATAQVASTGVQPKPARTRGINALETALVGLLAGLAVWKGLLPGWRALNTDFPNYYLAARLIASHYNLDRLYDWIWFQRIAGKFGIEHQLVGFLGLTPFSALPVMPFVWLPVLVAKRAWLVCSLVLLAAAVHVLSRQCGISLRRSWLIALCAVIPLRTSLLFGQMHILVLTLLVAAYVFHMRGRQVGSGCCIAVAAALKVYPVFFCAYFLFQRRWKAFSAPVLGLGVCLSVSYLVAGQAAMDAYLFQQLPRSLQGESGNPFLPTLTSSSALFHRLFIYEPELNPHPLVPSPVLYTVLYPLWQAVLAGIVLCSMRFRIRDDDKESLQWSAFLCLLMFLSSAPAIYQFVVLIAAAVPTVAILLRRQWWREAAVFAALYLAACNLKTIRPGDPVSIVMPLLYLKLCSGVALVGFYCFLLRYRFVDDGLGAENRSSSSRLKFAIAVACLWVPGAYGAWSHLRAVRAPNPISTMNHDLSYMRISPVSTSTGLLYVAMEPSGYLVRGAQMPSPAADSNQLSFAANASGQDIWVETVENGSSQVARIAGMNGSTNCRIDNAETPALAFDGTRIAFLREELGRGSLWVDEVSHCNDPDRAEPVRITGSPFDVRTVSATINGRFLISAVYQGLEQVFTIAPGESPQLLAEADTPLDAPSLSGDGETLIVRKLIAERWQLMSLELRSGRWKQLTYGDCNAYTPSWQDDHTVLFATDCLRGLGLTSVASLEVNR